MDESSASLHDTYDYLFKFLVIGSAGAGKSCLLHQIIELLDTEIENITCRDEANKLAVVLVSGCRA